MMRSASAILFSFLLLAASPLWAQQQAETPGLRIVELEGRPVAVQAIGLERRRPGAPVIVFEAGATSSLEAWRNVVPDVAALAPVIAYDRSGLGRSEWDGLPPTPAHVVERLRRLLSQIGADPPYLLVGHSWGGMLIHYFAGRHPGEVAGLVFVDPAPMLTQERSANLIPFDAVGAGRAGYEMYWSAFGELVSRSSPAVRAEFDMMRGLLEMDLDERGLRPLPAVPLVVIVAGKFLPLPIYDRFPFDGRAYFEADLRHRIGVLREWALASPDGLLLVSSRSTHSVPREAPDLIAWSINRVWTAASAGSRR